MTMAGLRETPYSDFEKIIRKRGERMWRKPHLLTVNQYVSPTAKRAVDVVASSFKVGSEIDRGRVEDTDAVTVEAVIF